MKTLAEILRIGLQYYEDNPECKVADAPVFLCWALDIADKYGELTTKERDFAKYHISLRISPFNILDGHLKAINNIRFWDLTPKMRMKYWNDWIEELES